MIEVKECSKAFGTVKAVNKATLDVGVREVFGLVGSNGAGKSTLLRMMAGIIRPDEGEIQIDGMPVYENEEAKKLFFYISDDSYFPTNYTAMDLAAAFLYQALGKAEREGVKQDNFDFSDTGAEDGMVRLFINIGKKQRVRPGDILGAVAGESGMPGDLVGAIDMFDSYTFVEVPREYGAAVLKAMKNAKIKGKSINVEPANAK